MDRQREGEIPSDVEWIATVGIMNNHVIASDGAWKPHNTVTLSSYSVYIRTTSTLTLLATTTATIHFNN